MFGIFILKMLGRKMLLWEDASHPTSTEHNSHFTGGPQCATPDQKKPLHFGRGYPEAIGHGSKNKNKI